MKLLILLIEDYGILYKPQKWRVLYDKCIGKSMVVYNRNFSLSRFFVSDLSFNRMTAFKVKKPLECIIGICNYSPCEGFIACQCF